MVVSKDFKDMLRTADKYGNIAPWFLGTEAAEWAESQGMFEKYPCEIFGINNWWQRLTKKGWEEKRKIETALNALQALKIFQSHPRTTQPYKIDCRAF